MLTTLSIEDFIPPDHPIRKTRVIVDAVLHELDDSDNKRAPLVCAAWRKTTLRNHRDRSRVTLVEKERILSQARKELADMNTISHLASTLLKRDTSFEHSREARRLLDGARVLVTGAAGSIGSEISRQAHELGASVYFLDCDESRLHALKLEISGSGLLDDPSVVLADIRDAVRIRQVFSQVRPQIVFHAAAHKHLPLLERYPSEGVKTNTLGTLHLVSAAVQHGAELFVNVSTDKAADPTSTLGATKRLAEAIVAQHAGLATRLASVRFGNVLGSRGSLIDTLRYQIPNGLPVSITDPRVERYFMTIPEAVGLVIESAIMAGKGETYVLDMGEPVLIMDIVQRFADVLGCARPQVEFVGLRSGEKLSEDLFARSELAAPPPIRGSRGLRSHPQVRRSMTCSSVYLLPLPPRMILSSRGPCHSF